MKNHDAALMRAFAKLSKTLLFLCVDLPLAFAQSRPGSEPAVNRYFESVIRQPPLLLAFLREMPKGGDLHNHLAGSVYAEDLIRFAAEDQLCLERGTSALAAGPCDSSCALEARKPAVECGYRDPELYNAMIDAWSMRNWERGHNSGHDHFFRTFLKFDPALRGHEGEAIAAAAAQAAADRLQYLELMHTAGGMTSAQLGARLGWETDFSRMRSKLLEGGLKDAVAEAGNELDRADQVAQEKLGCGTPAPALGCRVKVRYLYQVLRGLPPEQVFAQILTGSSWLRAIPAS